MADDDREIPINGGDNNDEPRPEDYFDDADNGEEARANEMTQKLKSLEIEKRDLVRDYSDSKEKIASLEAEIESLRKQDAVLRKKFEAMAREIKFFKDEQKEFESMCKRSVELETEVLRLQRGREATKEAPKLKKLVEKKDRRLVELQKEVEDLKRHVLAGKRLKREPSSSNLHWPMIVSGSAGAIAMVAAIANIRNAKCSKN